jgi:RHS repeat-associated protein
VTNAYDALNRRTSTTDPRGGVTTYAYDGANNLTSLTDTVGNTTTFVYDSSNRLTQQTDPLNHSSTFAYDLANRLTSATDRDGRRIDYTYDNDNRKTGENWVVSGSSVNTLTFSYDGNDNLLTAANNAGTYTMSYDALNRVTVTQEPFGLTLTATYDAVGNRTQLQDSFNGILTSIYDAADRLTSRKFGGAGQTALRIDLTYTPRDQIATEVRYSDLNGNTKIGSSTFTYDPVGRLTNLQHLNGSGGSLANYTYTYDLASRVTTEVLNGTTTTYQYDAANELTNDTAHSYNYDLNGNRNSSGYATGPGNEMTNDGTWTYSYDNEGNLIKKSKGTNAETWTYGYDNRNHLVWAKDSATDGGAATTLATYVYDALGNRIEKDVWTGSTTVTRFGYDGDEVWVDLTSGNALQTRYLRGDMVDQLFARTSSAGTAAWYLTDQRGSARNLVDSSGAIQDTITYDGWGNVVSETNTSYGDRYKWTGREFDAETGLQYSRARVLDLKAGRWTTQDPSRFAAGDDNLYRYAGNDPTTMNDPNGRQARPNQPTSGQAEVTSLRQAIAAITFQISLINTIEGGVNTVIVGYRIQAAMLGKVVETKTKELNADMSALRTARDNLKAVVEKYNAVKVFGNDALELEGRLKVTQATMDADTKEGKADATGKELKEARRALAKVVGAQGGFQTIILGLEIEKLKLNTELHRLQGQLQAAQQKP